MKKKKEKIGIYHIYHKNMKDEIKVTTNLTKKNRKQLAKKLGEALKILVE